MFFDYHRKTKQKNRRHIIFGAMIASFVTGIFALLFAPKSGKELRKDIASGAKEASQKAEKLRKKTQQKLTDEAKNLQQRAAEVRAALKEKMSHKEEIRLEKIENEEKK